jgi:magnesium chelatase accessory protein
MADGLARIPLDWPHRSLSRSLEVGGLRWHVQVGGSGPAVLLLHGTGGSAHSWADVIPHLMEEATVIAPDLPGHGFTEGAALSALTLPQIAHDLSALLARLDAPPVRVVAGHSAGAPLALRWALGDGGDQAQVVGFNPALVAPPPGYMTLVAPFVVPIATSMPVARGLAWFGTHTALVQGLLRSTGSTVSAAQQARYIRLFGNPEHVRGAMGLMAAADLPALIADSSRIRFPVTFVLGEADPWIPGRALGAVIARSFAGATVLRWRGGHLLHEVEPERAAFLIRERLAGA